MRALIPISAFAIALGSGAATAGGNEPHGGSSAALFQSLDRNSDQRLSQAEASSDETVASRFVALDVDGDGYITKREYTAHMEKDKKDKPDKPYGGEK